ncbi:MAG TPA: two-component regulator propeller domain-containing protein, partial [Thermoanaerobaculia bacterium]|nr:two-component regulator propeller domain-containing protein [Thermoanaerobaculia bacterium]HQP89217.1 two-component regulator propeller domain-containing protein [Thermoanaerobaculia bacterium]
DTSLRLQPRARISSRALSRYDGKFFTVFREKDGLSHRDLWSLQKDSSGNLWVGTMAGVCRYDGKCFSRFPLPLLRTGHHSRFTLELVWSIYEDGARRLWFGTDGTGVVEYGARSVVAYTTRDGLCSDNVCSILQDRQRNLWFGTWDGGVSRYDGSSFTTFLAPVGAAGQAIWTMLEDRAGRLWFGTSGGGVYRYDGTAFRHFSAKDGLGNQHVQSILEDRRGRLWFGTSGGVYRFDGARFLNFTRDGRGDAKSGTLGGGTRMEGNPRPYAGRG